MKVYVDEFHKTVHFAGSYYSPELLGLPDEVNRQVLQDFQQSNFDLTQAPQYKLLVDFGREGQCDRFADTLIQALISLGFRDVLVIFNTCVDTHHLSYKAVSMPENMIDHEGWFDLLSSVEYNDRVDAKFICLMRRPTPSRARIAASLAPLPSIKLSFASSYYGHELPEYREYFPGVELPILLDDYTRRELNSLEHDQRNPIFHSCLFNLVVESGSQTDYNSWRSIFITEKTFKVFALRQIPVWFAVPGIVSAVRSMGFDLFDDIVDHNYDSIQDESARHSAVIQQVKELDSALDLTRCQELRRSLRARLDNNYDIVARLHAARSSKFRDILERFYAS